MIYLSLFYNFLAIGALSFGGGYAMISLVRDTAILNGWLTEEQFMNILAVSESTPGPVAVNMATFVGADEGGILGSLVATLGVILPSFLIILLIVSLFKNVLTSGPVKAILTGIRPTVIGLIVGTASIMFLSVLFGIKGIGDEFAISWKGIIIFSIVGLFALTYKLIRKKSFPPILLIIISAVLGILINLF